MNQSFAFFLAALGVVGIPILLHPLYFRRGLTDKEASRTWPGDDAVEEALPSGTRGITVSAPAEYVWPWLTQIGQDRAGFYSYRWLENLVGARMPDVRRIVPEWTSRSPGQDLVMAPVERFGPIASMAFERADTNRFLVYKNLEGVWGFHLEPISEASCRLVARGTWRPSKSVFARMLHYMIFDPIHYIMEWKMLRTIKALAESAYRNR